MSRGIKQLFHPPDPPFHWIPLDRLEKNRSRTPLLPEPTAMDTLYEQLKVSFSVDQIRVLVPQRIPNLLCHTRAYQINTLSKTNESNAKCGKGSDYSGFQYCQGWVRLELDTHLAQQALREALDTKEVQEARERLNNITDLSRSSVSVPLPISRKSVSTPEGITVVPEDAALTLMEGVVKGGYPVDISSQSTAHLTSISLPERGNPMALTESGLHPAAVAQLEATVLDTMDFTPSIADVIQPMEMAELVDILPTLSLIEENPSGPFTPSVIDMLNNFGHGIGEENSHFVFEDSSLIRDDEGASEPNCVSREEVTPSSTTVNASESNAPVSGCDFPREVAEMKEAPSRGASFPVRSLVEWDRPSTSSS
ncbi:hypothetical protein GOODEAATRI_022108 [Goodea atripinnis]|uniref:Uncharacterized protein n=1 Tax=Goodea atripinnis TaxID=208336 RepID=A0ABV0NWR2_9TELE